MSDSETFHFFPGTIARFRRRELFIKALRFCEGSVELAKLRYRNFSSSVETFREVELALHDDVYVEREQFLLHWMEAIQRKATLEHPTLVHLLICPTERRLNEAPVLLKSLKKSVTYTSFCLVRIRSDLQRSISEVQQEIINMLGHYLFKRDLIDIRPDHLSLELIVSTLERCERNKELLLVVMVEEAHMFPETLLEEFFSLCNALRSRLRIAIIALCASELTSKSLRIRSSPFDRIDVSVCPSASDRDSANILSLKLASSTDLFFKLSAATISYLFDKCSRGQPLSVTDFSRLYLYCMLEHFRCNEATVRCVTASTFDEADRVLQRKPVKRRKNNKLGNREIGSDVQEGFRDACNEYMILHRNFFFGIQVLSTFSKCPLGRRFGSTFKDIYCLVQRPGFVGSKEWREGFLSLIDMDMEEFDNSFQECRQLIENNKPTSDELELAMKEWRQSRTKLTHANEKTPLNKFQGGKVSLRKLQQEIELTRQSASQVQVSLEKKALNSLSAAFSSLLQPPSTLSLYTASYYNDYASLHSILEPSLWRILESRILECSSSDASIIFSLYRSHVHDSLRVSCWFSEFKDRVKHSQGKPMELLLARFYRVLADFEYVGIISPYRRIFGISSSHSITMSAVVAVILVHVVLVIFVYSAMNEDSRKTRFIMSSEPCNLASPFFPCKFGGKPAWLNLADIPSYENLKCGQCSAPMTFLLQIYAPVDSVSTAFHRMLYVFLCKNKTCWEPKQSVNNVTVFRSQLPRINDFYPEKQTEPCTPEGSAAVTKVSSLCKRLCEVCGIFAPNFCGKCQSVHYCSKEHQRLHWNVGHKQECSGSKKESCKNVLLFPEYEIVTEVEQFTEESKPERSTEKRMEAYRQYMASIDLNAAKDKSKNYGAEELESMSKEADKDFKRFRARIEQNPEQVIRYQRGGQPLLASQTNPFAIPACEQCGAERLFEFQIMPHLLTYMDLDTVDEFGVDWATVCIYTCSASCDGASQRYLKEYSWKQDYNP
ncbi:hypothetical protein M513_06306 [Trichuris suis]|uniref:MYND-type domain-containing protein n=1 Tax=Trichuris suis TaxID=68888 RepID=A0A085M6G9_9BILA|nr:hypothetical protein M513_06306 [Trichuris suis]